jgi:hypothetical protein
LYRLAWFNFFLGTVASAARDSILPRSREYPRSARARVPGLALMGP